ncbi:MAG: hypothetical protein ABI241_07115 [Bacteroidia bacterium]
MLHLLYNNYIKKSTGTKAKGYHYEVVSMEEYETLKNSISSVLDDVLEKIKEIINAKRGSPQKNLTEQNKVNSLPVVQQQHEPLQPNSITKKSKKFKSSSEEVSDQIILSENEKTVR